MLAKCILASPATGHCLRWRDTLKVVKTRLHRWCNGEMAALWSEAIIDSKALHARKGSSSTVNHNTRRAILAVQNGQYRKAMNTLTSDGLASPSPDILQEMLAKYPQAPPPSLSCSLPSVLNSF